MTFDLATAVQALTALAAIVAAVTSHRGQRLSGRNRTDLKIVRQEVIELRVTINGRMSELVALAERAAHSEGMADARATDKALSIEAEKP